MEYGAIDLHKKESQIRIVTEGGQVIDQRIATTRERFTQVFWGRPPMRVLVESSTESEWVAQHLEEMGHEVVVADPNYAPMYGQRSRRIKTDRRDVAALTEACQRGTYRPAHRRSARQQEVQSRLHVRQGLTQTRTRAILLARSITRAAGLRIAGGESRTFLTRLQALEMSAAMTTTLAPLRNVIEILNEELASADDQFKALVEADPLVKRLTTLPGIGPITASAFVATIDVPSRFDRAGQVTSYLGLVPQEYSSGEKQRRGHLVRSAHPYLQSLLVQAAWGVWRASDPRTAHFREWVQGIARRRGKKVAVVALARRLARTLFAMWRDQTDYQPPQIRPTRPARNDAATVARSIAVPG
jgi:transposase